MTSTNQSCNCLLNSALQTANNVFWTRSHATHLYANADSWDLSASLWTPPNISINDFYLPLFYCIKQFDCPLKSHTPPPVGMWKMRNAWRSCSSHWCHILSRWAYSRFSTFARRDHEANPAQEARFDLLHSFRGNIGRDQFGCSPFSRVYIQIVLSKKSHDNHKPISDSLLFHADFFYSRIIICCFASGGQWAIRSNFYLYRLYVRSWFASKPYPFQCFSTFPDFLFADVIYPCQCL